MSMRAPCRLTATLTATSADAGCDGWVVGVVGRQAEGVAKSVDGLALQCKHSEGRLCVSLLTM